MKFNPQYYIFSAYFENLSFYKLRSCTQLMLNFWRFRVHDPASILILSFLAILDPVPLSFLKLCNL